MAKAKDVEKILDARREFTIETSENEIDHYFIANPTGEDIRKSDWQYSKVYNQAIVDGFLTQSQMIEVLKEKGIITDEYAERVERVRTSLAAELFKLENLLDGAAEEDREVVALEVAGLRDELFQVNQMVNGPMGNTCENLAEDARTEYLTSRVVQKRDGDRFWESFEDYRQEENTALCVKSRFEVMLWMQGLGSDFLENTPEQKVLREIAQTRLNKALEEAEKESEKAEAEVEATKATEAVTEAPVEEISLDNVPEGKPKAKAKRGRPKGPAKKKTSKRKKAAKKAE